MHRPDDQTTSPRPQKPPGEQDKTLATSLSQRKWHADPDGSPHYNDTIDVRPGVTPERKCCEDITMTR